MFNKKKAANSEPIRIIVPPDPKRIEAIKVLGDSLGYFGMAFKDLASALRYSTHVDISNSHFENCHPALDINTEEK